MLIPFPVFSTTSRPILSLLSLLLFSTVCSWSQQPLGVSLPDSTVAETDLPAYLCAGPSNFYIQEYLNTCCDCPVDMNARQKVDTVIIDFVVNQKGHITTSFIAKGNSMNTCTRFIDAVLKSNWWHTPDLKSIPQKVQCRRTFYIDHWQGFLTYTACLPEDPAYYAPQQEDTRVLDIFDVSKPPAFPGGDRNLYQWLAGQEARIWSKKMQSDYVVASFVVNRVGAIRELQIIKDESNGKYGPAALALLQKMPRWLPGEANGWPVNIRMTLRIYFEFLPEEAVRDTLHSSMTSDCSAVPVTWNEARFPGGYGPDTLFRFIAKNNVYMPLIDRYSVQHAVFVKFTVEETGKLTCITATMSKASSAAGYGREALRLMSLMPDWIPATGIATSKSPLRSQSILTLLFP